MGAAVGQAAGNAGIGAQQLPGPIGHQGDAPLPVHGHDPVVHPLQDAGELAVALLQLLIGGGQPFRHAVKSAGQLAHFVRGVLHPDGDVPRRDGSGGFGQLLQRFHHPAGGIIGTEQRHNQPHEDADGRAAPQHQRHIAELGQRQGGAVNHRLSAAGGHLPGHVHLPLAGGLASPDIPAGSRGQGVRNLRPLAVIAHPGGIGHAVPQHGAVQPDD